MGLWSNVGLLLLAVSIWVILRPYAGIAEDAVLYSFQAFARLHPDSLGGDVFLSNVSQDSFTLFPAVHARAIEYFGLETASLVLTLIGQIWWFVAAGFLAYRLVGPRWFAVSLGLVAAYPSYYGAFEVFRYAEPFITSRLYGEALVLTGLVLLLSGRRVMALLATLTAVASHPLMGIVGFLAASTTLLGPKGARALIAGVLGGLSAAIVIALAHPIGPLRTFDPEWFGLIRTRSPFLVVQDWNVDTWTTVIRMQILAWLAALIWRTGIQKLLLTNIAVTGLAGIAITAVGASAAHVVLLTQGQAWRWMWLVQVVAILAAPVTIKALWSAGKFRQSALLFLLSGWLLTGLPALVLSCTALVMLVMPNSASDRPGRYALLAAIATTVLSMIAFFTTTASSLAYAWSAGYLPVIIVIAAWQSLRLAWLRVAAFAAIATLSLIAASSLALDWSERRLLRQADLSPFQTWRRAIPPEAEVFWPQNPDIVWFTLERRSYISHLQTAGALFSRETTMELLRRTQYSAPSLSSPLVFGDGASGRMLGLTESGMARLCQPGGPEFVVTRDLAGLPEAAHPIDSALEKDSQPHRYGLVDCASYRGRKSINSTPGNPT